ncbi:MAG TPA: hypothetical protein VLJ15_03435 [Gammaproteobacteria bacterium]|nr:hypothetical protein [Gammaproteobacteria bacterium]
MPDEKKQAPTTLADCFVSIQANASQLKGFGRRLGPNNTFTTSDYAEEVKAVKEGLSTAIATLRTPLPATEQKELETKMATLQENVKAAYNNWIDGQPYKQTAWDGLFADMNSKLDALAAGATPLAPHAAEYKKFAEDQKAELKAIQEDKQLTAVRKLERSLENQHTTNYSLHLSHQIAKNLYNLDVSSMFEPLLNFDEKKLDDEIKGVSNGLFHGADRNTADDEFRKRVKKFIESPRKLFTSERFKDANGEKIVYERTREGGWWPRPPLRQKGDNDETAYKNYKHAYEGAFTASHIFDKSQVWVFSVYDSTGGQSGRHPIQTAADIKIKILSVFEAAQKVNIERAALLGTPIQLELDDETRNHLSYLKKTHPSDKEMIKHIDAIMAIELDLLNTVERQKLIGKDAKEHMQALNDKEAKLEVPKLTTPGGATETLKEQLAALPAGLTPEAQMTQLGNNNKEWLYTTPAARVPGATALQLDEIKAHLTQLEGRIGNATSAESVMVTMLDKFKKEATAQPDAPELQPTSAHMKKLEELQDKNREYLVDLNIRAGVFKQALLDLPADPRKAGLLAKADEHVRAIEGRIARNNELSAKTIPEYKAHQEKALKTLQDGQQKRAKI